MKIEEINKQIETCVYCPFQEYKFNRSKELGFGKPNKIMFIGSSPSMSSNKSQGHSSFDSFFNKLLLKVEITPEDYYFTNLCKTSIPANATLTEDQVKHCMSHLQKEILAVNPQIIVLLGRQVRSAFMLNWPENISVKIFKSKDARLKTVVYTLQHPGYLKYKPEDEEKYLLSLRKIFKYYKQQLF